MCSQFRKFFPGKEGKFGERTKEDGGGGGVEAYVRCYTLHLLGGRQGGGGGGAPCKYSPAIIIFQFCVRFESASLTDTRINTMNEVINGIRVIKMYTWEHAFKNAVSVLRK